MNARPGYWDVERCAWVGAEPTHVVPPVLSAVAVVPGPRTDVEAAATPEPVAADAAGG